MSQAPRFHAWALGPQGSTVSKSGRQQVGLGLRHEATDEGFLDVQAFLAAAGQPWLRIRLFTVAPPLTLYEGPLVPEEGSLPAPFRLTAQACSRCHRPLREFELETGLCTPCHR